MSTLSVQDAAIALGISTSPIRAALRSGDLEPASTDPIRVTAEALDEWVRSLTDGHGPECYMSTDPFRIGRRDDCACVACHCGDLYERGWMGSCARCHRPLVINGQVVRPASPSGGDGRSTGPAPVSVSAGIDAQVSAPVAASHTAGPAGSSHQPTEKKGTDQVGAFGADLARTGSSIPCDTDPRSGLRAGRWTCACGHGATAHDRWTYCALCGCDRFRRPRTNDAATPGRVAAPSPSNP
jgi:hypothetical protein